MKKSLVALFLVLTMLATMLAMPAMADEAKPEGWNNVNAEGYVYPDYNGETLRIMWWGSDTRAGITIKVIEMYEALTGLKIEYEYYDGGSYWTQFQAKMAANDLPDVFQMGNNWATYYDTITPLNDYIADGTIDTTAITETMIATTVNNANGDVTGMSNGTNARCFAYNPAIFDECGVAYPTENWTWDDFAAAARTIHEKTGNPAITTLEYNSLAYILDLLTTLMKEGVIGDYGIQNEIGTNVEADYIAYGEAAMMMLSSNQFQALSNVASENGITLKLCTIPRVHADGQSGMVVRSSQQMSIYSGSEKKDIAANFLNFFVNSIEANKILNCERGVSINSDVLAALKADPELSTDVTGEIYTLIDLVGSFPDAANSSPAEPTANEEISNVLKSTYFQGLYEGNFASAQEAADQFWAEAQQIWARYETAE